MAGFDGYLKQHEQQDDQSLFITEEKKDAFISAQKKQTLSGATNIEDTAEMLTEKYEFRVSDETTFAQRTEYYFENADLLRAKAQRYRTLAGSGNQNVDRYAKTYKNRKASKRKGYAKDAAKSFDKAASLEEKIPKDLTGHRLYKEREKVIRLRMEGMEYAAKVKGQSDADEAYRRIKSRYSCLMILKDQLDHIRQQAPANDVEKLEKEAVKLEKEFTRVKSDLAKHTPDVQKSWEQHQKIDTPSFAEKCKRTVSYLEDKQARVLGTTNFRFMAGFIKSVRRDQNGNPMTKEDKANAEWNQKLGNAYLEGNTEETHQMMTETFERLNNIKLPAPAEIEKKGLLPALYKNPTQFADIIRFAEGIDRLRDYDLFTAKYVAEHPEFKKKIKLFKDIKAIYEKESDSKQPDEKMKKSYKDHFELEVGPVDENEIKAVPVINQWNKFRECATHKAYDSILKDSTNRYLKGSNAGDTLDRIFTFVMKPVNFDEGGKPVTEEDKKNHEWNMEFLTATKEGRENLSVIADHVENSLEHTYDNVEMPPEPVGDMEKEENLAKFRKEMDDWCERQIQSEDFAKRLFDLSKALSFDVLKDTIPGVKKFREANPKFAHQEEIITHASRYLQLYLREHYHVVVSEPSVVAMNGGEMYVREDKQFNPASHETILFVETQTIIENYQGYNEHKMDVTKRFDTAGVEELAPKLEEAEFKRLKEVQPEFTEEGFKILKAREAFKDLGSQPEYAELFDEETKQRCGTVSLDRAVSLVMKPVQFDKMGKPASEQDEENHEWNLQWLTAWKEDDFETRDSMIEETLPTMFDSVKDVPIPTEEQLKDPASFKETLQNWIDEKLKEDATGFLALLRSGLSINVMEKQHPGIVKFFEKNPKLKALAECIYDIGTYCDNYLLAKYKIGGKTDRVVCKPKQKQNGGDEGPDYKEEENANMNMAAYIQAIVPKLHGLKDMKDTHYSYLSERTKNEIMRSNMANGGTLNDLDEYARSMGYDVPGSDDDDDTFI